MDNQVAALKAEIDAPTTPRAQTRRQSLSDKRTADAERQRAARRGQAHQGPARNSTTSPYFHLGRDGDYFVSMKVRCGEDGKVDPAALAAARRSGWRSSAG
jgi:hypothetical protein